MLKIDYFQKQGDFSGNGETSFQRGSFPTNKRGLTALVCRYTTCVPGYTTVSVDIQHTIVGTLDVAGYTT